MDRSNGRWLICVRSYFDAAHMLCGYPGDCKNVHGHRWGVEVGVQVDKLDELQMGIDFKKVKSVLKGILSELDHSMIVYVGDPFFRIVSREKDLKVVPLDSNPTAEVIAMFIYSRLKRELSGMDIKFVRVYESDDAWVEYSE